MTHRVCNPPNSCSIAPFTVLEKHFHIFMLGGTQKYCSRSSKVSGLPPWLQEMANFQKNWTFYSHNNSKETADFVLLASPKPFYNYIFMGGFIMDVGLTKSSFKIKSVSHGDKVPNTLGKSRNTRGYYNICIFNTMLSQVLVMCCLFRKISSNWNRRTFMIHIMLC